ANVDINERLAESLAMISKYEESFNYYQEVNEKDNDSLFIYDFITSQVNRNDIAINDWTELIELDKDYQTVYVKIANVNIEEEIIYIAYNIMKEGRKI